jgi:hypothetical protein
MTAPFLDDDFPTTINEPSRDFFPVAAAGKPGSDHPAAPDPEEIRSILLKI